MKRFGMCSWFDTICSPFAWAHGLQITHHERGNRLLFVGYCFLGMFCAHGDLSAASVDGTSLTQYKTTTQIFRTGMDDYVRGFARLGNGFAVASRASAFMDTNISVSGQMDLGETGTLVLLNNLYFERNITLTSGGNIKGKATVSGDAKTIFLGGDMTLSATTYSRVLHITGDWSNSGTSGDLIIDGRGHTLDIQDRAQIFVDQNVTLTLRNMTIRTGAKSLNVPAIRLASQGSKLTLDDVIFDLGADFQFKQGQIFITDSVAVTGTSAFIYQSSRPSYITSGATLSFEYGTTFSVAPATASDTAYNGVAPYVSSNFIVLADSSSALYLNSCTLKTTYTGLRLTKGLVMFDNRVAVDTVAGVDVVQSGPFVSPVTATVTGANQVTWSPDGRFIYVGGSTPKIFAFNGTDLTSFVRTLPTSGYQNWTPDGRFWVNLKTTGLDIYRFIGNSQPMLSSYSLWTVANPQTACISPDGRFIAVLFTPTTTSITIQMWKLNGTGSPTFVGSTTDTIETQGSSPSYKMSWSSDGRFLAIPNGSDVTSKFYIYRVRMNAGPIQACSATLSPSGPCPNSVQWSPDGRSVAVINMNGSTRRIYYYRFDGANTLTQLGTWVALSSSAGGAPAVAWSPDGGYVAGFAPGETILYIYKIDATGGLGLWAAAGSVAGSLPSFAWSPDGRYFALTNNGANTVTVYSCKYVSSYSSQAFTTGLVFGNSALGGAYNANVRVLPGCSMALQGKMTDDSV